VRGNRSQNTAFIYYKQVRVIYVYCRFFKHLFVSTLIAVSYSYRADGQACSNTSSPSCSNIALRNEMRGSATVHGSLAHAGKGPQVTFRGKIRPKKLLDVAAKRS